MRVRLSLQPTLQTFEITSLKLIRTHQLLLPEFCLDCSLNNSRKTRLNLFSFQTNGALHIALVELPSVFTHLRGLLPDLRTFFFSEEMTSHPLGNETVPKWWRHKMFVLTLWCKGALGAVNVNFSKWLRVLSSSMENSPQSPRNASPPHFRHELMVQRRTSTDLSESIIHILHDQSGVDRMRPRVPQGCCHVSTDVIISFRLRTVGISLVCRFGRSWGTESCGDLICDYNLSKMKWKKFAVNPLSTNSWSKTNFSF